MRLAMGRQEVKDAINGVKDPRYVPCNFTAWLNPLIYHGWDFVRCIWARLKYPDDFSVCGWHDFRAVIMHADPRNGSMLRCRLMGLFGKNEPTRKYRKQMEKEGKKISFDSHIIIPDMEKVDDFIAKIPDPKEGHLLFHGKGRRYKLAWCFSALFENHWNIRGMENTLMDYYLYPEETHRLYRAMCEYHKGIIKRCKKELNCDGVFFCDDLGTQTGPFMSPELFREFFFPYYKELCDCAHSLGMHFWLHSCGNITLLIPQLIEAGVDCLHPIQKFANDQEAVFNEFHDQITFFYGLDLQEVIPHGTPDDVEAEIKQKVDTFSQATGRLVFTFGNCIMPDCSIANFERTLKVSHTYNPYIKKHANDRK